jgi:stage II sporulation protein AA (anti-sigma F factor antagonist)
MGTSVRLIEVEREGDVLVLTPVQDLRELEFQEIEEATGAVLRRLAADPSLRGVVVDLGRTVAIGSSALGRFAGLWRQLRARGGTLALCNASAHEREILEVTGLAGLWTIHPSRRAAVEALAA